MQCRADDLCHSQLHINGDLHERPDKTAEAHLRNASERCNGSKLHGNSFEGIPLLGIATAYHGIISRLLSNIHLAAYCSAAMNQPQKAGLNGICQLYSM